MHDMSVRHAHKRIARKARPVFRIASATSNVPCARVMNYMSHHFGQQTPRKRNDDAACARARTYISCARCGFGVVLSASGHRPDRVQGFPCSNRRRRPAHTHTRGHQTCALFAACRRRRPKSFHITVCRRAMQFVRALVWSARKRSLHTHSKCMLSRSCMMFLLAAPRACTRVCSTYYIYSHIFSA